MKPHVLTVALNAAVDTTYLFDGFAVGDIHTVAEMSRVAGGKANNVARVLRLLQIPVVATGFAGGHAGAFIQEALQAQGIRAEYEQIPGESRTCFALVDRKGRSLTEIREKGPAVPAEAAEAFLDRFRRLAGDASFVVLSGSLPPGLPADFYAVLTREAKRLGARVVLDASGAALREAIPAGPDLVKPNRDELAGYLGQPPQDRAGALSGARAMRAAGAGAVALSLGAEGLLYDGPEGAWSVRPPAVDAINTVGSGDSLVAGIVAGLTMGLALPEALRLGVAAGTANALTNAVASPDPGDIERIRPQVIIEQL